MFEEIGEKVVADNALHLACAVRPQTALSRFPTLCAPWA